MNNFPELMGTDIPNEVYFLLFFILPVRLLD
jgi:hypothetical protein